MNLKINILGTNSIQLVSEFLSAAESLLIENFLNFKIFIIKFLFTWLFQDTLIKAEFHPKKTPTKLAGLTN